MLLSRSWAFLPRNLSVAMERRRSSHSGPIPDVAFTWVRSGEDFEDLMAELAGVEVWGFDTEFHREKTYYAQLALLQICWGEHIALVDPFEVDIAPLASILDDATKLCVAHAADQDLEVLQRSCCTVPARLFDTQLAAGFLGMSTPSLANLVDKELGIRLGKGERLTDWSVRPLSPAQEAYAASDVAYLLELHRRLESQLEGRGRLGWATEECEAFRVRPRGPQDPVTAWWRIKDNRSLRGAARGVAQEVAAWRENRAAELDIPTRYVLSDIAVIGIAGRAPSTMEELSAVRGLEPRAMRGAVGEKLLEAVARGKKLPPCELRMAPTVHNEREARPAIALAAAWVAQLGREEAIDPALLGTRSDITQLVQSGTGRLTWGWRHELVGGRIAKLASGEASLAFDGSGGLVLEERSNRPV